MPKRAVPPFPLASPKAHGDLLHHGWSTTDGITYAHADAPGDEIILTPRDASIPWSRVAWVHVRADGARIGPTDGVDALLYHVARESARRGRPDTGKSCGFVGCHAPAILMLRQIVGRRQTLPVCTAHAPTWARDGRGSRFYRVTRIAS